MFNILIAGSITSKINSITEILNNQYTGIHFYKAPDYPSAARLLENDSFHLFLLSIAFDESVPSHNILSFGYYIRTLNKYKATPVIFLSADNHHMAEAINHIHCYNYFTQPYCEEAISSAIREIYLSSKENAGKLFFRDLSGVSHYISHNDIIYIQSNKKQIILQTDTAAFITRDFSLSILSKALPDCFIQCHKSYIVHTKYIQAYDKASGIIHVKTDKPTAIPIGRTYKQTIDEMLQEMKPYNWNISPP